jgi:putative hydrolase of the HAD superfamily
MTAPLSAIGFDADDTLWHNERFYKLSEARFHELLADHAEGTHVAARLLDAERRNLEFYGYGIKGFTLSMIETAIEITGGTVPAPVIGKILEIGRELLRHPIETLPHVRETLAAVAGSYRLIMITKGDLFDQERKLAQSGLGDMFDAIEIVSEKDASTYDRIFRRHGHGPERAMMVGNSLRSDVVPAIQAGSWGVHVPFELVWGLEHAEAPVHSPRFRQLDHLGELTGLLAGLA